MMNTFSSLPYRQDRLILASASVYRAQQMRQLGLDFEQIPSNAPEMSQKGESVSQTASRLAYQKAQAVACAHPRTWVIGSDQTLEVENKRYGKPANKAVAMNQLLQMRNRIVKLHTALALINKDQGASAQALVTALIQMRNYSDSDIQWYLDRDQPWDCCGSIRFEKLGPWLIEEVTTSDPSAIIGLPLLPLTRMLQQYAVVSLGRPSTS